MVSAADLLGIMPQCLPDIAVMYEQPLSAAMLEFSINTPERQRAFIAQIAHESAELRHTRELWGPTLAQCRYEGRQDLGNDQQGDGERFMGRGLLQITGRANYRSCSQALYGDDQLLDAPEHLEQPDPASRSAAWFWNARGLNQLADKDDFSHITYRINGSTRSLPNRLVFLERAKRFIA